MAPAFRLWNSPIRLFLVLNLLIQFGNSTTKNSGDTLVVDSDSNIKQRISILVGKAGELPEEENGSDLEGIESDTNTEPASKSTSYEGCENGRCCFQYTWQGYIEPNSIPAPENTTCEYLKLANKDNTFACFDPIIYTSADTTTSTDVAGNPPDIAALAELSLQENWNVYCPLTKDKSCMTLRFYSRGGKKSVANETRFCGSVTESNSGKRITSGCYTENVEGFTKEVCVCQDKNLCNSAQRFGTSALSVLITFILTSMIMWRH